jgi:hypothetical protein
VHVWESKNLEKRENMAKEPDRAADAVPTGLLSGVTIYIYVGSALGK